MTLRRPWSVSAHRLYSECPRAWWLLNVGNVEPENTAESARGIVMHAGLAAGYAQWDDCRRRGLAPAVARHRVGDVVDSAIIEAAIRANVEDTLDLDEAYDTVMRALDYLGPQPGDYVIGTEVSLEIAVDGVPIIYRADVLYERNGVLVVRDWKSTVELPRSRDLTRNRQLALGALCAGRTYAPKRIDVEIASINAAVAVSAPIEVTAARTAGSVVAATARRAETDTKFTPTPGAVCADCKVRAYCPAFAPTGSALPTPGPDGQLATEVAKV